jgi:hypothetical protein
MFGKLGILLLITCVCVALSNQESETDFETLNEEVEGVTSNFFYDMNHRAF